MKPANAILTVECINIKNPEKQKPRFDQTLAEGSWVLIDSCRTEAKSNLTLNIVSTWSRPLGNKKQKAFIKSTGNLLKRASKYSEIDQYNVTLEINSETVFLSNTHEDGTTEPERSRKKRPLRAKSPGQTIEK